MVSQGWTCFAEDAPVRIAPSPVICFSSCIRFSGLSCDKRPVGRGLTFVPGDVETRIFAITAKHSLFPTSCARTAISLPRGRLSPCGGLYGISVFRYLSMCWVRSLLWTGKRIDCEVVYRNQPPASASFDLSVSFRFARLRLRSLHRFTIVLHTSYLAITQVGVPGGCSSHDLHPALCSAFLHCGAALDSGA